MDPRPRCSAPARQSVLPIARRGERVARAASGFTGETVSGRRARHRALSSHQQATSEQSEEWEDGVQHWTASSGDVGERPWQRDGRSAPRRACDRCAARRRWWSPPVAFAPGRCCDADGDGGGSSDDRQGQGPEPEAPEPDVEQEQGAPDAKQGASHEDASFPQGALAEQGQGAQAEPVAPEPEQGSSDQAPLAEQGAADEADTCAPLAERGPASASSRGVLGGASDPQPSQGRQRVFRGWQDAGGGACRPPLQQAADLELPARGRDGPAREQASREAAHRQAQLRHRQDVRPP